jgi:acetyl esterase
MASLPTKREKAMKVSLPLSALAAVLACNWALAADAVKKVQSRMGMSTAPEPGVTVKDMTVPVEGGSVPVHIYTPEGTGPSP